MCIRQALKLIQKIQKVSFLRSGNVPKRVFYIGKRTLVWSMASRLLCYSYIKLILTVSQTKQWHVLGRNPSKSFFKLNFFHAHSWCRKVHVKKLWQKREIENDFTSAWAYIL
ncbi:hypothetical protein O6H91_02G061400 [Diphasiastrum complanatum]|uniref:Uncharacterized protein n=1 Tax=Diphasiastrum complanatum TaxID=34168 RepID=A0ACC2EG68_DIPCM|nr:hypothetical protein O6H91_02G061400 [Diphasiastrum complanatum]